MKSILVLIGLLLLFGCDLVLGGGDSNSEVPTGTSAACKFKSYQQFCQVNKDRNSYLLVVDTSKSMKSGLWYSEMLDFLISIKCAFADNSLVRFGLVFFSETVEIAIPMGPHTDEEWIAKVEAIREARTACCYQATPLAEALQVAHEILDAEPTSYKKTVFTITDGVPVQIICNDVIAPLVGTAACWQGNCYNGVGTAKGTCSHANYMDMATYVYRHVQEKAVQLKSIARHMLVGVPDLYGNLPDKAYFDGTVKDQGTRVCVKRGGTTFSQCIKGEDGGYDDTPLVSEPIEQNSFVSPVFHADDFTTATLDNLCEPPKEVTAWSDEYTVDINSGEVLLAVMDNDDIDAVSLSPISLDFAGSATDGATVGVSGNQVSYQPALGFCGEEQFEYGIVDENGIKDTGFVVVTVQCAILAVDDALVVKQDSAGNSLAVLANDVDGGCAGGLTIDTVSAASHGGDVQNMAGVVVYTPANGFVGEESFDYAVSGCNGLTATATVTVTVEAISDIQVPDWEFSMAPPSQGTSFQYTLIVDTSSELCVDDIVITSVTQGSAGGVVTVTGNFSVEYSPPALFRGVETFSYTATSCSGQSDTGVVTVRTKETCGEAATSATCQASDFTEVCGVNTDSKDYLFLVDASLSIKSALWYSELLDSLLSFKCAFHDSQNVRFGVITFGATVETQVPLREYSDDDWMAEIEALRSSGTCCSQGTPLAEALQAAYDMLQADDKGYDKTVLTITDGQPVQIKCGQVPAGQEDAYKCWRKSCMDGVGTATPDCESPNYMDPATYTFRHVNSKAQQLKSIARHMLIGIPDQDNVSPDVAYFAGSSFEQGERACMTSPHVQLDLCVPPGDGGYDSTPLVSLPLENNLFQAQVFTSTAFTTAVLKDFCKPVDQVGCNIDAVNDSYQVLTDSVDNVLQILQNDKHSGCIQSISGVGSHNGAVSLFASGLIYSPEPGFSGVETVTYSLKDCDGNTDTADVTISVEGCPVAHDLILVVDESADVSDAQLSFMRDFINFVASGFTMSNSDVRVGLITFANRARAVISFDMVASTSQSLFSQRTSAFPRQRRNKKRSTGRALKKVLNKAFLTHPSRQTGQRAQLPATVVLLTVGEPNKPDVSTAVSQFEKFSAKIRQSVNTKFMTIGVTEAAPGTLLENNADDYHFASSFSEEVMISLVAVINDAINTCER